ncbi:MAG: dTMP kinase [bacterium]|nr:dTMP kinase [bacterium]
MKGLFIAFEGIEGSGKSTQAKLLYKWLINQGYDCMLTKEPGGTDIGKKIRSVLLDPKHKELSIETELFLYLADRAQHVAEVITSALSNHQIVITDRFSDSTIAYQGGGRGICDKLIKELNTVATHSIMPDLTVIIDMPPECGFSRIKRGHASRKGDRIELEHIDFHKRVRSKYLRIAKENKSRVRVVDGGLPAAKIASQIKDLVKPLLKAMDYKKGRR